MVSFDSILLCKNKLCFIKCSCYLDNTEFNLKGKMHLHSCIGLSSKVPMLSLQPFVCLSALHMPVFLKDFNWRLVLFRILRLSFFSSPVKTYFVSFSFSFFSKSRYLPQNQTLCRLQGKQVHLKKRRISLKKMLKNSLGDCNWKNV